MSVKKNEISRILIAPIGESILLIGAFWAAYNIRSVTDGIPFMHREIDLISPEQLVPFIITGVLLWLITFSRAGLYTITHDTPLFEEIRRVLVYSFFWFFVYIGFVYMTLGFIFSQEIPRLIIIYSYILITVFSIIWRVILSGVWKGFFRKGIFEKRNILVIQEQDQKDLILDNQDHVAYNYILAPLSSMEEIETLIRKKDIDAILLASGEFSDGETRAILDLARIYGIPCTYPRIQPHMQNFSRRERFLAGIPVIELNAIAMTPWESIAKRIIDMIGSVLALIILSPIMLVIYIGIKIEDPSGPAIFRNRRIGQDGAIFTLYKFRYMYWKYCVKEEYLSQGEKDEGLEYEEALKKQNNTRTGPLYKISNDPRKMRFGKFIERLSLDELPQLYNVLIGNMSLVGPRPHQPREVSLYNESDRQVLTIKPGITGMAQVYGRDKNTFDEEVALDTYYIEHYSILLDVAIILRTILVVLKRPFEKRDE